MADKLDIAKIAAGIELCNGTFDDLVRFSTKDMGWRDPVELQLTPTRPPEAIAAIKTEDILKDRNESVFDIKVCQFALEQGVTEYSGGSVQQRLDDNILIIKRIDEELVKRGFDAQVVACLDGVVL